MTDPRFLPRCALALVAVMILAARGETTNTPPAAAGSHAPPAAAAAADERQSVYEDVAVLTEALMLIRRNYVEEHSYQEIVYGAIHGMLASLDPHSDFLEPRQVDGLREETEGQFGGIGITLGVRGGYPAVIAPIEDSPAYVAGVQAGDLIVEIEGRATQGWTMDAVMKKLRGPPGEAVRIKLAREGRDPFEIRLVRDHIRIASVKGARVLRGNVGYVRITQFSEPTAAAFARALDTLTRSNRVAGLVLDLRDNPGGLLNQAVAVAQQLLPDQATIVSTRGREGVYAGETYRASGERHVTDIPLAVLVNRGSASASEIVTGALQDHRRAVVIGETSFGKASVQNIVKLATRPACGLKMTTAHYYTPSGRLIHGQGITPDIVVPLAPSAWRQVQMRRAYEEQPASFPPETRDATAAQAVDLPLERALDALIAARLFLKPQ